MHIFRKDIATPLPERFTDPFRYCPHPLVVEAARQLMEDIEPIRDLFAEGKMLGVLIVQDRDGKTGYISGFSGNIGGMSNLDGFVPPIYDLLDPNGHFKIKEAEITDLNNRINQMSSSEQFLELKENLSLLMKRKDAETGLIKEKMAISKKERDEIRKRENDPSRLAVLVRESQYEKAQLRRVRVEWDEKIRNQENRIEAIEDEINRLKASRASKSDELQKWIFNRYIVRNALGEDKSISEIFDEKGLVPPGGTGECAAPKLLNYAFRNELTPIAMGEFWYGKSPDTAVRTHGKFYPSCTSKCGPLLTFMTTGLELDSQNDDNLPDKPVIIFEDDTLIAVSKPSGMPSVPGLDGKVSLQEWLCRATCPAIYPVHRLDMDTSGIMIFAKDESSAVEIRKQFEAHTISKTYKARLSPEGPYTESSGEISLPLTADYDERPRQKVDKIQGKNALTRYETIRTNEDGTTDIVFHPMTGRTHQLRVHSAHHLGLGRPILGDMLYGGADHDIKRLHLHSLSITFRHPSSGKEITFCTEENIY